MCDRVFYSRIIFVIYKPGRLVIFTKKRFTAVIYISVSICPEHVQLVHVQLVLVQLVLIVHSIDLIKLKKKKILRQAITRELVYFWHHHNKEHFFKWFFFLFLFPHHVISFLGMLCVRYIDKCQKNGLPTWKWYKIAEMIKENKYHNLYFELDWITEPSNRIWLRGKWNLSHIATRGNRTQFLR